MSTIQIAAGAGLLILFTVLTLGICRTAGKADQLTEEIMEAKIAAGKTAAAAKELLDFHREGIKGRENKRNTEIEDLKQLIQEFERKIEGDRKGWEEKRGEGEKAQG